MTSGLRIIAVCGIVVFLGFLLREAGFKGAKLLSVLGMAVILCMSVSGISELLDALELSFFGDSVSDAAVSVMKIIGVGYIFGISSDICREMGDTGISSCMLVAGRVEILLISAPFFKEIFLLGAEMMQ